LHRLYALVAFALALPNLARADLVTFDYQWSVSPVSYAAHDGTGPVSSQDAYLTTSADGRSFALHYPGNRVDFTLAPPGTASVEAGSQFGTPTPIPFANLSFTGPGLPHPASVDFIIDLKLELTDLASGQWAEFTNYSNLQIAAQLGSVPTMVWLSLSDWWGYDPNDPSGSAQLGDLEYQAYTTWRWENENGWPFTDGASVAVTGHVGARQLERMTLPPDDGTITQAPEPASLVLGGVGLMLTGLAWLRRRRR
jgi:hypothetical protein